VPPSALDALADGLVGTFPACDDAAAARALLRELAKGEPVDAAAAPARWPNVEHDDRGHIVAFGGLSLTPTTHRFTVADHDLYTWCAWDTLFLPALLDQPAAVASRCPITSADVHLGVDSTGIRDADPQPLGISFPPPHSTSTADITGTFCCHVHFLAGTAAAERWLGEHPGGRVLALNDAFELGRIVTRRCCLG
jgi:alkylmercury lyase